ncbi:MAG TPA: hypothetical protein GX503_03135 [Clostridiales bacterium]|nr:hypothetical protein [Clostridiales bacterium]
MGRVERKRLEKENRKKQRYKYIFILWLIFIGISGILVVDHSLRDRMLISQEKLFEYEKVTSDIHRIHLYGKQIDLNEKNLQEITGYVKKEMQHLIREIRKGIVQSKEKFIRIFQMTTERFARVFLF